MAKSVEHKSWAYFKLKVKNEVEHKNAEEIEVEELGRNSQNVLSKNLKIFVTFRCFYEAIIHRK